MQISNILNESITMDEVNSQPFIEDFEGLELYHATPKKFDEIQKFNFRFREKPQTSVVEIHDAINRISQEKFGLPIRNLLFCTNTIDWKTHSDMMKNEERIDNYISTNSNYNLESVGKLFVETSKKVFESRKTKSKRVRKNRK